MRQWFDETLVAAEFVAEGRGYWKVRELPAGVTVAQSKRRHFKTLEVAEDYIADQWGNGALLVQPEDIAEEIERRRVVIDCMGSEE